MAKSYAQQVTDLLNEAGDESDIGLRTIVDGRVSVDATTAGERFDLTVRVLQGLTDAVMALAKGMDDLAAGRDKDQSAGL